MIYDLEQLKKEIENWLSSNPSDSVEILKSVTSGLKKFEDAIKSKRDSLSVMAIDNLIGLLSNYGKTKKLVWKVLSNKEKAVWLCDTIVHNFPKGFNSNTHQNGKEMLTKFCEWYFDESDCFRSDWERNIKDYGEYMEMLNKQYEEYKKVKNAKY